MKGFTLIELMVVVIIIGILAAIAIPQYELIVEKSRAGEALINARAIRDAVERHMQEYPSDTVKNFDQVPEVELQGVVSESGNTSKSTKNFTYTLTSAGTSSILHVYRNDGTYQVHFSRDINGNWTAYTGGSGDATGEYEQITALFMDL